MDRIKDFFHVFQHETDGMTMLPTVLLVILLLVVIGFLLGI